MLETHPRGTASVVGLGAIALQNHDPQAVMAVLTADHFIGDEEKFRQLLVAAEGVARDDFLVTLGIEPTYPATGFGYIQQGEKVGVYNGLDVYQVLKFKEKPQDDQARRMLANGNHTWNSGMFIWKVHHVLSEFELQMPELAAGLNEISRSWNTPERSDILTRVWPGLKTETIDYGIMEGAKRVVVIPARGLVWNDVR